MKKILIIFILLLLVTSLISKRIAILPEINRPYSFVVSGSYFYIAEKSSVLIYTFENFKLIKRFGSRGEGPGEFKSFPLLEIFPGDLVVNCFGKLLFFSPTGDFKKELKSPQLTFFVYPVGDNLVGIIPKTSSITGKKCKSITLFNKEMKIIKEIAIEEKRNTGKSSGKRQLEVITDYFGHQVYKEKIYVADTNKGFYIEVFDSNGNKLYEINKEYERLKVTDEYKEEYLKAKKNPKDFVDKVIKDRYKYVFRDFFPAYKSFMVKDGKIYIFTYKREKEKIEVIVMGLKGNVLKKVYLTQAETRRYYISNGKYYYLKENEKSENFELFAVFVEEM